MRCLGHKAQGEGGLRINVERKACRSIHLRKTQGGLLEVYKKNAESLAQKALRFNRRRKDEYSSFYKKNSIKSHAPLDANLTFSV